MGKDLTVLSVVPTSVIHFNVFTLEEKHKRRGKTVASLRPVLAIYIARPCLKSSKCREKKRKLYTISTMTIYNIYRQ